MKRLIVIVIISLFMVGCSKQYWVDEWNAFKNARYYYEPAPQPIQVELVNQPTDCWCHTIGNHTNCRCE